MPTEEEELKLILTLVDNITPGINKVRDSLKDLGGEHGGSGAKQIEKVNEGMKALTETIGKMTGGFGEAFKSLGMLRLGFLGGIAGVAAFGYEMAKQLVALGEYSSKMQKLGQLGKDIGIDPTIIKTIGDQLKIFGVAAEVSEAALAKFAKGIAELRRDPRVEMQILQQTAPAAQADMKRQIDDLKKETDVFKELEIARRMGANVERNARAQGQSDIQAADTRRKFLEDYLKYDPVLSRAGQLQRQSEKDRADDAKRIADAAKFSVLLGQIWDKAGHIMELFREPVLTDDSPMMTGLKKLSGELDVITTKMEKLREEDERSRKIQKDLPAPEGFWEKLNPFNPLNIERERRMRNPELEHQSYNAIGVGGNPLFQQAGFGLDDHRKGIDANTEQLKQLNDILRTAMGLDSGGGVHPAAFGSAEYPNLGGGGGGGGGGAVPRALRGGGGGGGGGGAAAPGADAATLPQGSLQGINRGWARAELAAKPWLREHLRRIVMAENPHPGAMNAVIESAMNRAEMQGISLEQALMTGAPHVRGAYYPHAGASPTGALRGQIDKAIDDALEGSDVSKGATDNSSGWLARKNERTGAFGTTYQSHGESFEIPGGTGLRGGRRAYDKWRARKEREIAEAKGAKVSSTHLEAVPWMKDYGQYREEMDRRSFPGNIPPEGGAYDPATGNATGLTRQGLLDSYRRRMDEDSKTQVEGTGTLRVHVNAPKNTNVSAAGGGLFKNVETYRQTQMEKAEPGPEMSSGMPLP